MPEAERIEGSKVTKRRFDRRDFSTAAEFIVDELATRKTNRKHLDKQWNEVDRQLRMDPDIRFKLNADGSVDSSKVWMPEMELPDQAQTLEVTSADAKRMILTPGAKPWFASHVNLTDEYLARADFTSIISGDLNDVPSKIVQDNADKFVDGLLTHYHRQYSFGKEVDGFNAGAINYGTGLWRARLVKKPMWHDTSRGMVRDDVLIPRFFARSIKNVYLDDSPHKALNEGVVLGPAIIAEWKQLFADIALAAKRGSNDENSMDGGWMPGQLEGITPDKKGHVQVIEYEGDIVIPRKTTPSMVIRRYVWTVVVGSGDAKVIRLRRNKLPFMSWVYQPYHVQDPESAYGVGPLMLGRPIQTAGTEALNRLMQWTILNTEPPMQYDRDDAEFEAQGGPVVEPRAFWRTMSKVNPVQIGEGQGLLQVFSFLQSKYADVTGTDAPRLGAQTVSHTTAFSKEAELSRSVIRTVDYVSSLLEDAMTRSIYMEYEMAREAIGDKSISFYSDAYGSWLEITKDHLPDQVAFEVFGAGGPAEEQAKMQRKLQAIQLAINIEVMRKQLDGSKGLDLDAVQKQIMREGGWVDIDPFFAATPEGLPGQDQGRPGVEGDSQVSAGPAIAGLQAVS